MNNQNNISNNSESAKDDISLLTRPVMICLIGEQPLPNILPVRYYNAEVVVLLYTERTEKLSFRIQNVLRSIPEVIPKKVQPYDIVAVRQIVVDLASQYCWSHPEIIFNLTGGTKPMAYACYDLARAWHSQFCYLQSEGIQSVIHHYVWDKGDYSFRRNPLPGGLVGIDDYLRIQVDSYESGEPRNDLEAAVRATLQSCPDFEVLWSVSPGGLGALEIDFIVRAGDRFGAGEVKTKGDKRAIDQINAVAEQLLGTYAKKFLVSASPLDPNNADLAKAYGIRVIEVEVSNDPHLLEPHSQKLCYDIISESLGGIA